MRYKNDNTILHLLAERNDFALVKKLLSSVSSKHRNELLASRNRNSRTPLAVAKSKPMKTLLEWSELQQDYYYLATPPVVLIMHTTEGGSRGESAREALETALKKFEVQVITRQDLTKGDMMDAIREAQEYENLSALMVVVMSPGEQGIVQAADGAVEIDEILLQMCSPCLKHKPKVR